MAASSERIADLERQLADLRSDFEAHCAAAEIFHTLGCETGSRASLCPPAPARQRRGSHLRSVGGDQ
jgi:hypothetical protein